MNANDPSAPLTVPLAAPLALRHLDLGRVRRALHRLAGAQSPPWLHGEVAKRMGQRLGIVRDQPAALLDWWGFSGAGAAVVAQAYPHAHRWVVEPSAALKARSTAAARVPWWSLRRRRAGSVTVIGPDDVAPASVQLVWSNMMLHGAADPTRVMALWHRALGVGGFVMFSCLGPGSLRELSEVYRRLAWPAPMADLVDMHDLGDMLVHTGFSGPVMDQETIKLSWPSAQALLDELRTWGGNASPDRFQGLRTPRWHASLMRELDGLKRADGRWHLQVEVAYGHAFKAPSLPTSQQETTVSLDEMRSLLRQRDVPG